MTNFLEFVEYTLDSDKATFIRKYLQEKKILVLTWGAFKNVIRFIPPLNIERALLGQVLNVLEGPLKGKA
jgi:4-aminobutyrate aminotransferase-like enzyme